jgi:hypothetical protein
VVLEEVGRGSAFIRGDLGCDLGCDSGDIDTTVRLTGKYSGAVWETGQKISGAVLEIPILRRKFVTGFLESLGKSSGKAAENFPKSWGKLAEKSGKSFRKAGEKFWKMFRKSG